MGSKNKKSDLKPIGARLEIIYPPALCSTDARKHRHTYEVIGHVEVFDYESEKRQGIYRWAEELKIIEIEALELSSEVSVSVGG